MRFEIGQVIETLAPAKFYFNNGSHANYTVDELTLAPGQKFIIYDIYITKIFSEHSPASRLIYINIWGRKYYQLESNLDVYQFKVL